MLSQTKFYTKYKEEITLGLAWGLVSGLAWGFAFGLVSGLAWELAWGLVSGLALELVLGLVLGLALGLALGLVSGLASGLAWGLVSGLAWGFAVILVNWTQALPLLTSFYPILFLIAGIILISELMFWLMPEEKLGKNVNLFWHTCKRKAENIFEVLLGLSGIAQIYILIREVRIKIPFDIILKWIGYIGAGILVLVVFALIFYIFIKLNSLKYAREKCQK